MNQDKDKHFRTPSEANTDKHINFLEAENNGSNNRSAQTKEDKERRNEWERGQEEGRKAANQNKTKP
ncbi:MAG TPA: hypothetical protein VFL47_09460 [Flavisolibacter sp.]|nr:hypothetical protein [Flavisolibacter sp.]